MIPHVIFNYSWVYDERMHIWNRKKFTEENEKNGRLYIKKFQKKWDKIEKKVMNALSKVSGLKFKCHYMNTYIVTCDLRAFSAPLTLSACKSMDSNIRILIHELIHNLLVQNKEKVVKKCLAKYSKFSRVTKIHILVHAIQKETLKKLFGEKITEKSIKRSSLNPDYKKAWDIVEKEGTKNIIKEKIRLRKA